MKWIAVARATPQGFKGALMTKLSAKRATWVCGHEHADQWTARACAVDERRRRELAEFEAQDFPPFGGR